MVPVEILKNPIKIRIGKTAQPDNCRNIGTRVAEIIIDMMMIFLRPILSLNGPRMRAPITPEISRMESAAPASQSGVPD